MGRRKKALPGSCPVSDENDSKKDRKIVKHKHGSRFAEKPAQRNAANARERARMRTLSKAFSRLKTTLPWVPPDTKLSKLDTLRSALSYIQHLGRLLKDDDQTADKFADTPILPVRLMWPLTPTGASSCQPQQSTAHLRPSLVFGGPSKTYLR